MWKDSETQLDLLDFSYLKNIVIDIINNENLTPSSIGIYGDWGSGKSSLMQLCLEELSKDDTILCIKFNGWLFEGYEDAKTALIGTIIDQINSLKTLSDKAKNLIIQLYKNTDKLKLASKGIKFGIDYILTGGIGTITDLTVKNVLSKLKDNSLDIKDKEIESVLKEQFKSQELRKDIRNFQNDFKALLSETKIKKLVVFIDELDRCNPDTILQTFEAIRLFLFTENTSFVIGADERHVIYSVKKRYSELIGNQIDIGKEYLEKIIQYPIRIPQLGSREVEFYILCLLFQNELTPDEFAMVYKFLIDAKKENFFEFEMSFESLNKTLPTIADKSRDMISLAKQLSSVLSTGLNGNPRHCKRFLNSLSMREKMASSRNIKIDRKILAKLMLLEYFKLDFFKKLSKVQSTDKGKPEALGLIEEGKWTEDDEFTLWSNDKWINKWLKKEPKLSGIDLRPYFYFSRESLSNQLNIGQYRLSQVAEKALSNLLDGAESLRNRALKSAMSINDSEANQILDKVFDKILSDSKFDSKIFRSLLDWGSSREFLYSNTINCLDQIPSEKVNISIIPRVKAFMDSTNKNLEIKKIVFRWAKDNPSLKTAIVKDFGEII